MATMKLSIVTPTGSVVDTDVTEATVPGSAGMFGVYPDHQSALIMLGGGILSYESSEGAGEVLIRGGVAEISGDCLLIITDWAFAPEDADRAEAEALLEESITALQEAEFLDESTLAKITTDRAYAESALKAAGN
jgi:F-type H+-transporting ATPase subunit epsilon